MAKKVASLKKRDKKKPMAFVDKQGNVKHFSRGKKATILEKKVVSKELLKKRKAKGKKGILLYVKGKAVYQTARKLRGRKKSRKARRRRSIRKLRKASRKAKKGRKAKKARKARRR